MMSIFDFENTKKYRFEVIAFFTSFIISFVLNWLNSSYYQSKELIPITQNIGIALLTILIPVVLFIFSLEKESLFEWDKNVIINKVMEARTLFFAVLLVFGPPFFWNANNTFLASILFGLIILGILLQIKVLGNSYLWINTVEIKGAHDPKNFRTQLRNQYLQDANENEKEKIWVITWQKKGINTYLERDLIQIFIATVDSFIAKKSYDKASNFLTIFFGNFNKRNLYDWIVFERLFESFLRWHYEISDAVKTALSAPRDADKRSLSVSFVLARLLQNCTLSALQMTTSYTFFDTLKKHAKDKTSKYLEDLFFRCVCQQFLENVSDSKENFGIWEGDFPKDWKVTVETASDKENVIARIWLFAFLNWASQRMTFAEAPFDNKLNDVAYNLFPEVEPSLWAHIINFIFSPAADDEDRMRRIISHSPTFGFMGRSVGFSGSFDEDFNKRAVEELKKQQECTYKLALTVFKRDLDVERLKKYSDALKGLECEADSPAERRKQIYLKIIKDFIDLSAR